MRRLLGTLALIALVAVAVYEGRFWYGHVHEANAHVQANFTVLASAVNGKLAAVHAARGDAVSIGDLLVTMDDREATLAVASLAAETESLKTARDEVEAELVFFLSELGDRIATADAETRVLDATLDAVRARLAIANKSVERNTALASRSVVTRQRLDDANDRLLEMTERLRELEAKRSMSKMRVTELSGQRKRELVYRSRVAKFDRQIDESEVRLDIAKRQLEDMRVVSPIDGILNDVHVNSGTYVEDGDPLLLLHDPADLWVEAHISESDIRLVKVGQQVLVELDAYPFESFGGEVTSIGRVTVERLANQGGEAAIGMQRIQVQIALRDVAKPLWPGMRASVNIVVR